METKDDGKKVNIYQEAIRFIRRYSNMNEVWQDEHEKEFKEATEILQELADKESYYKELEDKATPFKPLNKEIEGINGVLYGKCKCGCEVWETYKFCTDCGQAIDWSNDE